MQDFDQKYNQKVIKKFITVLFAALFIGTLAYYLNGYFQQRRERERILRENPLELINSQEIANRDFKQPSYDGSVKQELEAVAQDLANLETEMESLEASQSFDMIEYLDLETPRVIDIFRKELEAAQE